MIKRFRKVAFSSLLAILLLTLAVSNVFAVPPLDVHIEATEVVGVDPGPFTASGGAVDFGLICASGTVYDADYAIHGSESSDIRIIRVLKHFDCAGGDSFEISMVVRLDLTTYETTANWRFVGGTGPYASLNGRGTLTGTPIIPGTSVLDAYDGSVH